jgi:hypothetical protein
MPRAFPKLFIQKRRIVAVFLALSLSAAYLWQGLHFHGANEGESRVEAGCVFCKLAPNPSHGLRTQARSVGVDFNFSHHQPVAFQSLVSEARFGNTPIRAPPAAC